MPPKTSGEELAGELNLKSKMNENEQKLIRADLEAYIAKDSGIGGKPSIPRHYMDQKIRVLLAYRDHVNRNGADTWVKVDVKQCSAEELMQFTVEIKKANSQDKWKTAGKVVVIAPHMWGRWNDLKKDSFLKASFEKFV